MKNEIDTNSLAQLANIELDDDEIKDFADQLDSIITYMGKLNSLNTNDLDPTISVNLENDIMRNDVANDKHSLSNDDTLKNAPSKNKDSFLVPKVI